VGTFVYNPGVQVFIEVTDKKTNKTRIIDVSEDLVAGQLVRRSDGISQFTFTLQNNARKYDFDPVDKVPRPIFTPMDRIIVNMKRLKWVRVFTGYLDVVPAFQAWPGEVHLQASCSLKRLQYWYWDATLPASEFLIQRALLAAGQRGALDGGSANVARNLLQDVVNWPASKVHIGAIPKNWYSFAADLVKGLIGDLRAAQAAGREALAATGGGAVINGVTAGVAVNGVLQAGTYGGENLDTEQVRNAEAIYTAASEVNASTTDVMMALATSIGETHLHNYSGGDRDSVGLFQQRPSQGWGTVAECEDPTYSTQKFLSALDNIQNRWTGDTNPGIGFGASCQAVQRNGAGGASVYDPHKSCAVALVRAIQSAASVTGNGVTPSDVNADHLGNNRQGSCTGQDLVNVGVALVQRNPHITYREGNDSTPGDPNPTVLDCSSFTQWVYANATGSLNGMPRVAADQAAWCEQNGGQRLSGTQALRTPGALIFKSSNGQNGGVYHTSISLGDGKSIVGAHHSGTYASVETDSTWSFGFTAPDVTYTAIGQADGVTVSGDTATVAESGGSGTSFTDVSADSNDPIDQLFNSLTWAVVIDSAGETLSSSLTGVKALMNDQPILPYLMNLMRCSMRSICSAPNGDFMAWFPDYFGLWGTAAVMVIEDVELMNFQVTWSDLEMVTHQFVSQAFSSTFDLGTASLNTQESDQTLVDSTGVVTIDMKHIMKALFDLDPSVKDLAVWRDNLYRRFGARPNFEALQGIYGPKAEFFMALFLFMQNWAKQYSANVPMTFMPELWPGMLIQLPSYNFQAYVVTVTHSFQMGEGGSFTTTAEIVAPSRVDGDNPLQYGLPLAGEFRPGPGFKQVKSEPPPDQTWSPGGMKRI
jgi:hypothetical protein